MSASNPQLQEVCISVNSLPDDDRLKYGQALLDSTVHPRAYGRDELPASPDDLRTRYGLTLEQLLSTGIILLRSNCAHFLKLENLHPDRNASDDTLKSWIESRTKSPNNYQLYFPGQFPSRFYTSPKVKRTNVDPENIPSELRKSLRSAPQIFTYAQLLHLAGSTKKLRLCDELFEFLKIHDKVRA